VREFIRDPDTTLRIQAIKKASQMGILSDEVDRVTRNLPVDMSTAQEVDLLGVLSQSSELAKRHRNRIENAIRSPDRNLQEAGIKAAVMLGPQAIEIISPWLENTDVFLSATAAKALTDISPHDAAPLLEARSHSASAQVKIICAGYLLRALELESGQGGK
jgi:hypothetical protein